ncbi:MAG: pteridine reductase [Pseudomonadales bacterium]|nr:pteridine reductase [Pseudomonadales bacterium]
MSQPVVLITGAARRIGAVLARHFHSSGYDVVLHYNRSRSEAQSLCDDLETARPNSATMLQADFVQTTDWQAFLKQSLSHWGRVDVLINNASSFYPTPTGNIDEDAWQDLIGSNLRAPLFLSQAFAPTLKTVRGNIINIIDSNRTLKNYLVYSIAKAGLSTLTDSLAKELAPEVRVNGIAPGSILWPEVNLSKEAKTKMLSKIPLGRQGKAEDIAETALFLANSAYITGQIINVDGGRSLG